MKQLLFILSVIFILASCTNAEVSEEPIEVVVKTEKEVVEEPVKEVLAEESAEAFTEEIEREEKPQPVTRNGKTFPSEENYIERHLKWILTNQNKSVVENKDFFTKLVELETQLGNMDCVEKNISSIIRSTNSFSMLNRHYHNLGSGYVDELIFSRTREIVYSSKTFTELVPLYTEYFRTFLSTDFCGPRDPDFGVMLYGHVSDHFIDKEILTEENLFFIGDQNWGEVKIAILQDFQVPIKTLIAWADKTHTKNTSVPYRDDLARAISDAIAFNYHSDLSPDVISSFMKKTDNPILLMTLPMNRGMSTHDYLLKLGLKGEPKLVAQVIKVGSNLNALNKKELLGLAKMVNNPICWAELINSRMFTVKELLSLAGDFEKNNIERAILLREDLTLNEIYELRKEMSGEVVPEMLNQLERYLERMSPSELLETGNRFQDAKVWKLIRTINEDS